MLMGLMMFPCKTLRHKLQTLEPVGVREPGFGSEYGWLREEDVDLGWLLFLFGSVASILMGIVIAPNSHWL